MAKTKVARRAQYTHNTCADSAMVAVKAFADKTGLRQNGQYTDDLQFIVRDLLVDLMHYSTREEVDFETALESARSHYDTEMREG